MGGGGKSYTQYNTVLCSSLGRLGHCMVKCTKNCYNYNYLYTRALDVDSFGPQGIDGGQA